MRLMDIIQLVWTNLWRRKGRTILTTIGVIIGTAAIVTMMALGIGMQKSLVSQFESMGSAKDITVMPQIKMGSTSVFTTTTSSTDILSEDVIKKIKALKGVEAVIPNFTLSADTQLKVGRYTTNMSISGYDSKTGASDPEMAGGKIFNKDKGLVAVVGYKVPELFSDTRNKKDDGKSKGMTLENDPQADFLKSQNERIDVLHKTAQLTVYRTNPEGKREQKSLRVKIVGVIAEKGNTEDYSIYMPIQELAQINDWVKDQSNSLKKQGYESLTVRAVSTDKVDGLVQSIADMGYTAFSFKQLLSQLDQSFIVIQAILGGIGAIALLVASIGIINTMTMAIYERTKEIGIMKVVGASLGDIRNIFIMEAGTIGLLGGLMGVTLSYLISMSIDFFMGIYISSASGGQNTQSILALPLWLVIFAIVFAVLIGLLAGLYPAMKAARLSALSAIRTE